jgi:hypothetical protein
MAGKRFQVGSKVFIKKTGVPGIICENQGSKTWKIELVDPNGKPNSMYEDGVKSSSIRNPKENEFPGSSEQPAEQQQQKKKKKTFQPNGKTKRTKTEPTDRQITTEIPYTTTEIPYIINYTNT